MAFPPKPSDGQVDAYERVVNGHVIKVNAYAKKSSTTTTAAVAARKLPGRPRLMAKPGSFASGRDIVGMKAVARPPTPEEIAFQQQKQQGFQ